MVKNIKKSKMTIDRLARITQDEFSAVRKEMATKDDLKLFAIKDDLKAFVTKDDLKTTEVKILQAVDSVVTKFDRAEKEHAAHTVLHKRTDDTLHHHDQRIKKLEAKI